jgi:hypothetical protein
MTSQNPNAPKGDLSLSNNPFIWGNIALLAGVPWLLALSMAGLAVGDPVFPEWFEIFLLGFPAIALVAWVQWQQPISPFSLWFVTKPGESLSDRDRKILTLVKQHSNGWYVTGWIAAAVAIVISAIFCKIYISAPLAQAIAPFPAGLRLFGILWAEIFFLLSNILLQAGISALRIKLTVESELIGLKPFAPEKIKNNFTSIGWSSPQILKFFEEDVAIAQVPDDAPQVETAETSLDANEPEDIPEIEAIEPNNFVAEESIEIISEPELETIPHEEIVQEAEGLEPVEFLAVTEPEPLDITDISTEPELEPETNTEFADVSLDEQFVEEIEEVEDLEISEIIAEESVIETIAEPEAESEIEQFISEPLIETSLNPEIFQEPEELNPFELVEDENSAIEPVLDTTENEPILDEEIAEEAEQLEAFETTEEPELTFLETPDTSSEPKFEDTAQAEANLEIADAVLEEQFTEEQFTEDSEELESFETIEEFNSEAVLNSPLTSDNKKSLDFFKKSRKTGLPKKQGFGKSIKHDHNVGSNPDTIETEPVKATESEVIQELDKEPDLEAIAIPIEQELGAAEITTPDFDDELDEMIAFNVYVENILKEYLEEDDKESKEEESKNAGSLDDEIPEQIDPSVVFEPAIEAIAIAKESVEAFTEKLPDVETQFPADIAEEIPSNDQEPKDPKYLVQELLVDKFLARLEELNVADKANKAAIEQAKGNISGVEVDEFADLEALLDGNPKNPNADDLSDRNS